MADPLEIAKFALVLFVGALLPPLAYLAWLRNTERYGREPLASLAKAFAWGATGAVAFALLVGSLLPANPLAAWGIRAGFWSAIVLAPVAEEFAKALGLVLVRDDDPEREDGFIYGAAAGLGFATTENMVYAIVSFSFAGFLGLVATLGLRSIGSSLLHAAASGVIGYGLWGRRLGTAGWGAVAAAYLVAVGLHAGYNYLVTLDSAVWGFTAAILVALALFLRMRERIKELDREAETSPH